MKVSATLYNFRVTPRKARLVARLVKGLDVRDALVQLEGLVKRTSPQLKKLMESAVANAEHNAGLDRDNLYVFDVQVDEGTRLKRWLPRAYGRATLILKRMCHLTVILDERVEGKNRKSKEQLEKERKARETTREQERKDRLKEEEQKEKETQEAGIPKETRGKRSKGGEPEKKQGGQGKWMKKIFQRKSV